MFHLPIASRIERAIENAQVRDELPVYEGSGWMVLQDLGNDDLYTLNACWEPAPNTALADNLADLASILDYQSIFTGSYYDYYTIEDFIRHEREHAEVATHFGAKRNIFGVEFYLVRDPDSQDIVVPKSQGAFVEHIDLTTTKLGFAYINALPSLLHPAEAATYGKGDEAHIRDMGYESFGHIGRLAAEAGLSFVPPPAYVRPRRRRNYQATAS